MSEAAWESLHKAALELAKPTALKQRLTDAYLRHLADLSLQEMPGELRQDFEALRQSMTRVRPQHGECAATATVRKMSTGEADACAARIVGPTGLVVGVDPSQGMLAEAAKVFKGPRVRGYGQALPIRSDYFDFVTMGIALRHVSDLRAAFSEYLRVLKPGGRVWILEGHVPRSPLGQKMTRFVWAKLIPGMTLVATRSREAKELMDYYWDTVDKAVPPETIVKVLEEVGFTGVRAQVTMPGAFVEYTGTKPKS